MKKRKTLTRAQLADKICTMLDVRKAARIAREAANKKKGGHE